MENTLGELLQHDIAKDMLDQFAIEVIDETDAMNTNGRTITEIITKTPEAKPMFEAIIAAVNAQERIK